MKATITLFGLILCIGLQAQFKFEEGTHYTVVAEKKTAKPEVKEFFSLFCGHCFQFEPFMDSVDASLPNGIKLEKSHVSYLPKNNSKMQELIMKAFMVMRELDKEKELVRQVFAAYHARGIALETQEDLKKIFVANGVDGKRFDELMASEDINAKALEMNDLWLAKQIESVPTIVVNGKYRVNMITIKSLDQLKAITAELLLKD